MNTIFETEPCSRCGGTGRFSHNGEHDRCYKCDGKNGCRALTKRGAAAQAYYNSKFRIRPEDVKVGDIIKIPGQVKQLTVAKIEKVSHGMAKSGTWNSETKSFDYKEYEIFFYNFENVNGLCASAQYLPSMTDEELAKYRYAVRRVMTAEELEAAKADALAYQETLTKAGKPRKR